MGFGHWSVVYVFPRFDLPLHWQCLLLAGMMDWDNTRIVFTKRTLIEFLRYVCWQLLNTQIIILRKIYGHNC